MKYLVLSKNKLFGAIPNELGNLNQLEQLSIYENTFCGKIPESFSNLSDLSLLSLDGNQLLVEVYTDTFRKWMGDKGFKFGSQDSRLCEAYCGDNVCQASEMNKMGETTCAVDCKVVETWEPQTPTKTTGKDGLDGGKLINNK